MSYIGNEPQLQGAYDKADDISSQFDGSATTFEVQVNGTPKTIGKATNLIVGLNGSLQEPDVDYSISDTHITFTTAPASGVKCSITILGDVFKAPATGNTDLNSLTDVVIGSPSNDQVLTYQGGTWVNAAQGTTHLSNNSDVDTSSAVNGDKLVFDGVEWKGEHDLLNNINDVNVPSPSDNQVLTWDNTANEWQAKDAQSTVNTIDDLNDVDTTTNAPTNNQVLTWNGTIWVPADTQESIHNIDDLGDVDTTTNAPLDGQFLKWDSATNNWVPATISGGGGGGASSIDDLTDVDTTTTAPTNGQVLKWNGTNWVPADDLQGSGGGGASSIDDLTDVDTTTSAPTNGQVLKWNGTNWVPADDLQGSGGGGTSTPPYEYDEIYVSSVNGNDSTGDGSSGNPYATLNKAWDEANNTSVKLETHIILEHTGSYNISPPVMSQPIILKANKHILIKSDTTTKPTITINMNRSITLEDNTFIEFKNVNIEAANTYSYNLCGSDGTSFIFKAYDCTFKVQTLVQVDYNLHTDHVKREMYMYSCTHTVYDPQNHTNKIEIRNYDNVVLDGYTINPNQAHYQSGLYSFERSNIKKLRMTIDTTSLHYPDVKYINIDKCFINEFNLHVYIDTNSGNSASNVPLDIDDSTINSFYINCSSHLFCMSFNGVRINKLDFDTNTSTLNKTIIWAYNSKVMHITFNNSTIATTNTNIVNAYNGSMINISEVHNFGSDFASVTTSPVPTEDNTNIQFRNEGSIIQLNETNVHNDSAGSGSGSGSGSGGGGK